MGSRQLGVLMMVVFLSIMAPIGNTQDTVKTETDTTIKIEIDSTTVPVENSIAMENTSALDEPTTSSINSHLEEGSSNTSSTSTTTFSGAVTTINTSQVSTTKSPVTNDHAIRDVTSDMEKCATSFKIMEKDKKDWVPEKAFLVVSGADSHLTVEQFCDQLHKIERLNALCSTVAVDADDVKVAPIVAGLAAMFNSTCQDPKNRRNVTAGDSTTCAEFLSSTAKNCSTKSLTKEIHVYPTQVLFEEMTRENCTGVFSSKDCIARALDTGDECSPAQQAFFSDAMAQMTKGLSCVLHSTNATTSIPATTEPSITAPETPGNAGTNFQTNFFTLLPVLLLAFKLY